MQQYKLVIAYDGTAYHGWQVQPDQISVAGVLQTQFQKTFGQPLSLVGASRTDAGVHALGQVAMFKTDLAIEPAKLQRAWQGALPADILIRSLEPVVDTFHAQYDVRQKTYWYHIFTKRPLPFYAPYGYCYRFPFDVQILNACLQEFVGTHDFRSFCTGDEQESTIRTVDAISVKYHREYGAYRIVVKGPGFLRYMIRRMVGAALHVATSKSKFSAADLVAVLHAKNPLHCLPTAPAKGLMLRKIVYEEEAFPIISKDEETQKSFERVMKKYNTAFKELAKR